MMKVCIIVPMYNAGKYIERCIQSICRQTYHELEVLVVDDGSTDDGAEKLKEFIEKDSRIRLLTHSNNKGLYHARLTGVEAATGKYIAFVDSDDYISCDFIRTLVCKAEEEDADIVIGKTIQEDEKGYQYIQNLYHFHDFGVIEGEEILKAYWEQEGRCFVWHTIWNKLYTRELWHSALQTLKKQDKHLIMAEDFVFSSVLFNYAQKLACVEYGAYIYYQHSDASTSLKGAFSKFKKNILDLKTSFDFVYDFINSEDYHRNVEKHFERWSDLYLIFWKENIENAHLEKVECKEANELLDKVFPNYGNELKNPSYFYTVTTEYDKRYDKLVELVSSDEISCVSFDVFDTAIVRPFYQPKDLFWLLDNEFCKSPPNEPREFHLLRIQAEEIVRDQQIYKKANPKEDININEIYHMLGILTDIDEETLVCMKEKEEILETKMCYARKSIFNVYQVARHCGKKIFFTSDMYLSHDVVGHILEDNGYVVYDKLLISGESDASKRTGKLYDVLKGCAGLPEEQIVHIGDNWDSDVTRAQEKGIRTYFYPSSLDCIQYNIPDVKTTHSCCPYTEPSGSMINYEKAILYLGTRSALSVAANIVYDNPFISFNEWTEMNCSPVFIGTYALGMHLLGFTKWFTELAIKKEYDTLLFVARDGYLPMKAYEIMRSYYSYAPASEYFYTSRKTGIAASIKNANDLYILYENINTEKCTINNLLEMLYPVLGVVEEEWVIRNGWNPNAVFEDYFDYCKFIKTLIRDRVDEDKCRKYHDAVKKYYDKLAFGKTACVDIGYSGRTQEVISHVTSRSVDAFYVHTNDDISNARERNNDFEIFTFYDSTPSITGGIRELLFSKYAPSCVSYVLEEDEIVPKFEDMKFDYLTSYVINEVQQSALQFVKSFCQKFGDHLDIMEMRNYEISYPYEYFLHSLTENDAKMFQCIEFEDDMWAGGAVKLIDYWRESISYHKIIPFYLQGQKQIEYVERMVRCEVEKMVVKELSEGELEYLVYVANGFEKKNKLLKAAYWYLVDKKYFSRKLKERKNKKNMEQT